MNSKAEITELELDGHIYIVEKDKEGNEVAREELDGKLMLNVMLSVLTEAVEKFIPDGLTEAELEELAKEDLEED